MKNGMFIAAAGPLSLLMALGACGGGAEPTTSEGEARAEARGKDMGEIRLSADQIASAGIQIGRPTVGASGTIRLPATIEGDPQGLQIVSAAIGGRVVALTRNLGEPVGRGQVLAIIESREAASLNAQIEAAKARLVLASSTLSREERLFSQRVSPEQDVIAARTAAAEARIALRLAQQQRSAAGGGIGGLNRIGIMAPISGSVIARNAVLGQTVAADAELFRIAKLSTVSLSLSLQPQDAGRVRPGAEVTVEATGRTAKARVTFVSPALDMATRLVPVIATLDNRDGAWRVGEPVTASIALSGDGDDTAVRVPATAVQSWKGKPVVFVRTAIGFRVAPVTLGDNAGDSVIIRTGLKGTEEIATTSSFTLKAELGKGEAGEEE